MHYAVHVIWLSVETFLNTHAHARLKSNHKVNDYDIFCAVILTFLSRLDLFFCFDEKAIFRNQKAILRFLQQERMPRVQSNKNIFSAFFAQLSRNMTEQNKTETRFLQIDSTICHESEAWSELINWLFHKIYIPFYWATMNQKYKYTRHCWDWAFLRGEVSARDGAMHFEAFKTNGKQK